MRVYLISYLKDRYPLNYLTDVEPLEWLIDMLETYKGENWSDDSPNPRKTQIIITNVIELNMTPTEFSEKEVLINAI